MSDNTAPGAQAPGKKGKTLIVIAAVVLALAAASFFAYAFLTKSFWFKADAQEAPKAEEVCTLEEFVLNLKDASGRRYLKTQIALGVETAKEAALVEENRFRIRDVIIQTLRSKTAEDIMAVEKTDELKGELKESLNALFDTDLILEVYIVDFLIQ